MCGSAPEAYAQPWLGLHGVDLAHFLSFDSRRKATDVLREAIIQSTGAGTVSTMRQVHLLPLPQHLHRSREIPVHPRSPLPLRSALHPNASAPNPPLHSAHNLALERRSRGSRSSSSSSSGSSSGSGSGSGSREGSPARSEASAGTRSAHSQTASIASVKVLSGDEASGDDDDDDDDASYSANEADVSQGSMSLLDISVSDDEDTRKCKAHELARKSDTNFTAWKDKLISDGVTGLQERDNVLNDYADSGKRKPKNPDSFGPPVSYMEDRGVFKPLASTTNPLGLCHFYPADPTIASTLPTPKPPAKADHVKGLLLLAKMRSRPYIVVVFLGGAITALGLLQELHTRSALARIPIYRPEETKDGHRPRVCCCPFCAYTVQNDPAYLNHIVGVHYNANFACGTCLSAVTPSCQQMKKHIADCKGLDPLPRQRRRDRMCLPHPRRRVCVVVGRPRRVPMSPNMRDARRRVIVRRNRNQSPRHLRRTLKAQTGA